MKRKVIFGLTLLLTGIPPVIAPTNQIEKSEIERILDETEIINRDAKKLKELQEMYNKKEDYVTNNFYNDKDEVLLARMLLGETEDCSKIEKIAVGYSALNRLNNPARYGRTLKEVILKPYQYSAFNEGKNAKLKKPLNYNKEEFLSDLELSKEILAGKYLDPTSGATHYANPDHPDLKGNLPSWANKMKRIGRIQGSHHIFYKEY